jgi:hypothetical protein
VAGDTYYGSHAWSTCYYPQADGSLYVEGTITLTGTIVGCGTGTVNETFAGTLAPPDATGSMAEDGYALLLPSSGTGGLSSIAGGYYHLTGAVDAQLKDSHQASGWVLC